MSWLGMLNFVVLQWAGVRLARVTAKRPIPGDIVGASLLAMGIISREEYYCRTVTVGWKLLRWVCPLTGWWSDYRWIAKRRKRA